MARPHRPRPDLDPPAPWRFGGSVCIAGLAAFSSIKECRVMVRTLEIAIAKAAELSDAAQEQLGRDMLERIDSLAELRAALEVGVRQLDAGEEKELRHRGTSQASARDACQGLGGGSSGRRQPTRIRSTSGPNTHGSRHRRSRIICRAKS